MDQSVLAIHLAYKSIAVVLLTQPSSSLQACAVDHMASLICRPAVQMIVADLAGVLKPIEGYLRRGVRVVVEFHQPQDTSATGRLAALTDALQLLGCSEAAIAVKGPACIHTAIKQVATDFVCEKTKQVAQWSQRSKAWIEAMTAVLAGSSQFALTAAAQQQLEDLESRPAEKLVPVADAFWLAVHEVQRLQQHSQAGQAATPALSPAETEVPGSSRGSRMGSESSAPAAGHSGGHQRRMSSKQPRAATAVLAAAAARQVDEARAASAAVQHALRSIRGLNPHRGFGLHKPPSAPAAGDAASMSAAAAAAAGGDHGVSIASTIAAHPAAAAAAAAEAAAKPAGAKWWQKPAAAAAMAAATAAAPAGIAAKSDTAAAPPPAAGTSPGIVQPQQLPQRQVLKPIQLAQHQQQQPHQAVAPQQQQQHKPGLWVLQPTPLLALPTELQQQQQQQGQQQQLRSSVGQGHTGFCTPQYQQQQQPQQQPQQRAIALLQQQLQMQAAAKGQLAAAMRRLVGQPSAAAAAAAPAAAAAAPRSESPSGPTHTTTGWGASMLGGSQAGAGRSTGQAGVKRAAAAMLEGAHTPPGGLQLLDAAASTLCRVNRQSQTSSAPVPAAAAAASPPPAPAAASAAPAGAAAGVSDDGDSGIQPAPLGSGAAAAAAGTIGLFSVAQLVLGCLQQGSLGLEPGAAEDLLQTSGLAGTGPAEGGTAWVEQLLMGSPDPWVQQALQLGRERGIDWKQEIQLFVDSLSAMEGGGAPVSVTVRQVRAPTQQEQARGRAKRRRNRLSMQQQQQQQQQPSQRVQVLVVEADVLLPADQAQQQQGAGGARAVRFGEAESSKAFSTAQRLHSPTLLLSQRAQQAPQEEHSQPDDADKRTPQQQQAQAEAELMRQLYGTLAGLLKWQLMWQLRGQQRQLLQMGSFALLQVERRDQALPAKPTVGASKLVKLRF